MKTIKHILFVLLATTALSACVKEPFWAENKGNFDPDKEITLRFNIKAGENKVATRSLNYDGFDENAINDINVFVFDNSGTLHGFRYIDAFAEGSNTGGQTIFDVAGKVGTYQFAIIANAGENISDDITTLGELRAKVNTITNGDALGENAIMSVLTSSYTIASPEYDPEKGWIAPIPGASGDPILLKRRTAKVTVTFDMRGLSSNGGTPNIDIQSISLKQVPKSFTYFTNSTAPHKPTNADEVGNGDYINSIDGNLVPQGEDNDARHAAATPLYMLENMQGTKIGSDTYTYYTYNSDNPSNPKLFEESRYTSPRSMVPDDGAQMCSYIEIIANYSNIQTSTEGNFGEEGQVIYKIYLGTGLTGSTWNNFDVQGNTWYKVTVELKGKGGIDEINWRIETDIERYGPDSPDGTGYNFSYTIHPADALFWLGEEYLGQSIPETQYQFSTNQQNINNLPVEYFEGRYWTFAIQSSGNLKNNPAVEHCMSYNGGGNGKPINNVEYYLPGQNELQMINIFHRDASFNDGTYWSSTQLHEGANNNNQYARVVNFTARGEAYTQTNSAPYFVRCLMTPEYRRADKLADNVTFKYTYNGKEWDGLTYPRMCNEASHDYHFVIVNREEVDGVIRGLKSVSLRTGAPYSRLTPNYHTIRKVYTKFQVARADCAVNGTQLAENHSVYMDWYTAVGYLRPEISTVEAEMTPRINSTRTGCNAYYEDNDPSQIGKWRVPTSLELQQMWLMGASEKGTTPANPAISYAAFIANSETPTNRLPSMHDLYKNYNFNHMTGVVSTLQNNITNHNVDNPDYSLQDTYWSCTTTLDQDENPVEGGKYANKMDFYSGDGYSGIVKTTAAPIKTQPGKVRCVRDYYP